MSIDRFCIVRCRDAGVHFGTVISVIGRQVELKDARRLWSWEGANTLNEVSLDGITSGRVSKPVPEIVLLDACEVLPCSDAARTNLESQSWN